MRFVTVLVILAVAACNSPRPGSPPAEQGPSLTADQAALIGCRSYATTLNILAGYRRAGRLHANEIAAVDQARAALNAACAAPSGIALTRINSSLSALLAVEQQAALRGGQ